MLPLTLVSAFPEEAGLLVAGTFDTPDSFEGDLAAFLGGIDLFLHLLPLASCLKALVRCNGAQPHVPHTGRRERHKATPRA
jgi:hypothetical protein